MRSFIFRTFLLLVTSSSMVTATFSPSSHQLAPTIQKIGPHAIAARDGRKALAAVQCLFDNPQLLSGTPAAPAVTICDDFSFRH